LAGALADHLRQAFLASVAPDLVAVPATELPQVEELARKMGLPAVVRHMEVLGKAQVDMREAPDPRVHLEVVLIRLTHPEADDSAAALLERIERLERAQGGGGAPDRDASDGAPPAAGPPPAPVRAARGSRADEPASPPATAPASETTTAAADDSDVTGPELARRALRKTPERGAGGRARTTATTTTTGASPGPTVLPAPEAQPPPAAMSEATSAAPSVATAFPTAVDGGPVDGGQGATTRKVSRDELVQLWGDGLLASLPNRARARFRVGRFVAVDGGTAVFALPNETHRSYCEDVRVEVETALAGHFGTAVPLRLVVDDEADGVAPSPPAPSPRRTTRAPVVPAPEAEHDGGHHDLLDPVVLAAQTEPAGTGLSPEELLKQAFPGAEEV